METKVGYKGRPRTSRPKGCFVKVYTSEDEKDFAASQGVSASGYLRMLLLKEMKKAIITSGRETSK